MKRWIIILSLLAVPIMVHEAWHAGSDPRSPLHPAGWVIEWARPLFEDESLVAGHVFVNFCTVAFISISIMRVVRQSKTSTATAA